MQQNETAAQLVTLPSDIILLIIRYLPPKDAVNLFFICKRLHALTIDEKYWKSACSYFMDQEQQSMTKGLYKDIFKKKYSLKFNIKKHWKQLSGEDDPMGDPILDFYEKSSSIQFPDSCLLTLDDFHPILQKDDPLPFIVKVTEFKPFIPFLVLNNPDIEQLRSAMEGLNRIKRITSSHLKFIRVTVPSLLEARAIECFKICLRLYFMLLSASNLDGEGSLYSSFSEILNLIFNFGDHFFIQKFIESILLSSNIDYHLVTALKACDNWDCLEIIPRILRHSDTNKNKILKCCTQKNDFILNDILKKSGLALTENPDKSTQKRTFASKYYIRSQLDKQKQLLKRTDIQLLKMTAINDNDLLLILCEDDFSRLITRLSTFQTLLPFLIVDNFNIEAFRYAIQMIKQANTLLDLKWQTLDFILPLLIKAEAVACYDKCLFLFFGVVLEARGEKSSSSRHPIPNYFNYVDVLELICSHRKKYFIKEFMLATFKYGAMENKRLLIEYCDKNKLLPLLNHVLGQMPGVLLYEFFYSARNIENESFTKLYSIITEKVLEAYHRAITLDKLKRTLIGVGQELSEATTLEDFVAFRE